MVGTPTSRFGEKVFFGIFYENPNPGTIFFVYVKLLISLLNGALFRLGENFSVRGYGARFLAALLHQLFKLMVGTPTTRCAQPVWGKKGHDIRLTLKRC